MYSFGSKSKAPAKATNTTTTSTGTTSYVVPFTGLVKHNFDNKSKNRRCKNNVAKLVALAQIKYAL